MEGKVLITLKSGIIGTTERQRQTVAALGLRYREHSRAVKDSPSLRGMVNSVAHLVTLEKIDSTLVIPNPFGGVAEYELGPQPEKKEKEKKKTPSVKKVGEESHEPKAPKKEAKAEAPGKAKGHLKAPAKPHKPKAEKASPKAHKKAK